MESIYQHYREQEQAFVDTVFNWIQQAQDTYAPILTTFLTPREKMITKQLVASYNDLTVSFEGGYEKAERSRAMLYFDYYQPSQEEFEITCFNIKFPPKYALLTHSKILGTFMSTGVERDRIGDIITDGNEWHCIVDKKMALYFSQQITKIANVGIQLMEISADDLLTSSEQWYQENIVVSSMRLDTLLSKVYNFSRQRSKTAIRNGLVKVNFIEMVRPDAIIDVNDIVSLRKFGRFKIETVDGMTKKENYRLTVNILEH